MRKTIVITSIFSSLREQLKFSNNKKKSRFYEKRSSYNEELSRYLESIIPLLLKSSPCSFNSSASLVRNIN